MKRFIKRFSKAARKSFTTKFFVLLIFFQVTDSPEIISDIYIGVALFYMGLLIAIKYLKDAQKKLQEELTTRQQINCSSK